jgi:signal transduction histidine kinase
MSAGTAAAPTVEIASEHRSAVRVITVAIAYLVIILFAAIYPLVSPLRDFWNAPVAASDQAADLVTGLLWFAVLLVTVRRNLYGRLWKLIFLTMTLQRIPAVAYVPNSLVFTLGRALDQIAIGVLIQLIVSFPTGYLRDRFDRAVVGLGYCLVVAWTATQFLFVGDWWHLGCDPDCVTNAIVVWPDEDLYNLLRNVIAAIFVGVVLPLVFVALWRHWRSAGSAARRVLLPLVVAVPFWLVIGAAVVISVELDVQVGQAFFATPSGTVLRYVAPMLLPAGLLLGILRTRWDRGRVAGLVVELGHGVPVGGLREILARALGDPTLQLAFIAPSGTGFVDAAGQSIELPVDDPDRAITRLERDGEVLGILVHDPAVDAEDPGLVEAVGNAARMALENERLAAEVRAQLEEVRASRARIVDAADAERRRVERDLHDGAQQRLVALALRLQVARSTNPEAADLLDEATSELQTAIGEVRGLARGVHPTILTEAGLAAAVEALAERTSVPVVVDIPDGRWDPALEATAYFVIAEALTNVTRYADATEARVSAHATGDRLMVSIVDDGRGGADPAQGSGLRGLQDRVAAIDGTLAVDSPNGSGTTVTATLPIEREAGVAASPTAAPRDVSTLARVRAVPGAPAPTRSRGAIRSTHPATIMAIVAVSIGSVAVLAAIPTLSPQPPVSGRAADFVRPFDYQFPATSDIRLKEISDHLNVLSPPPGNEQGISIWAVEDVLRDRCSVKADAARMPRTSGVDGLLTYLRSVPHLRVQEIGAIVIDGRPAYQVDVSVVDGVTGCEDPEQSLFLWRDPSPAGEGTPMQVQTISRVPLTVLDVDGATIALEVWRGGPGIDEWIPTANDIIASIRFLYRPPWSASPSVGASSVSVSP